MDGAVSGANRFATREIAPGVPVQGRDSCGNNTNRGLTAPVPGDLGGIMDQEPIVSRLTHALGSKWFEKTHGT